MKGFVACVLALALVASAEIYFQETFSDDKVMERWVHSNAKQSDNTAGEMKVSAGKFYADAEDDKGFQTSEDSRFYMYTAAIPKEFSNKDKTLVFQYQLKQEQHIDCGGGSTPSSTVAVMFDTVLPRPVVNVVAEGVASSPLTVMVTSPNVIVPSSPFISTVKL